MTDDSAFDLLVRADPVTRRIVPDSTDVVRVVRAARASGDDAAADHRLRPRTSRRRRLGLTVAGVAVVATVVSVGVGVLPQSGSLGVRPPAAVADPVALLRAAAAASVATPFTPPRPDQFLHVHESDGYQAWISMDGTHDGLILQTPDATGDDRIVTPGCRDGVLQQPGGTPESCTPEPAYRTDVPTDPAALQRYLVEQAGSDSTNSVAKQVLTMLEFQYLSPDVRAALYTVLSDYSGLSVVDVTTTPDAVGVTWSYGGGSMTLVFGRLDHEFRGVLAGAGGEVDTTTTTVVDAAGRTG